MSIRGDMVVFFFTLILELLFFCIEHLGYFQKTWDLWKKKDDMNGLGKWVTEKDSRICIYVDLEER